MSSKSRVSLGQSEKTMESLGYTSARVEFTFPKLGPVLIEMLTPEIYTSEHRAGVAYRRFLEVAHAELAKLSPDQEVQRKA